MVLTFRHVIKFLLLALLSSGLSGCYIFNFFQRDNGNESGADDVLTGTVLGQSLGQKAGGVNEAALAGVYEVSTSHAPAAIRPDPDTFIRNLLLQYRPEGKTVARQIGRVEEFRLLLGGATEDFSKAPQESYDATSLLAVLKVAEEICVGLVAPNVWQHEGWNTILPFPADAEQSNIAWLAQRITGKPSSTINQTVLDDLQGILDTEEPFLTDNSPFAKYVPVCAALALDAEALYL